MESAYKFDNKEGTRVLKYPSTFILQGSGGWDEYLEYVAAGGTTDPRQDRDGALAEKLQELKIEKYNRVDAAVGTSDPRNKDKAIARTIKLLRRETKGTINPAELTELNAMEAMDDHLDLLVNEYDGAEQWLEDPARTIEEIQGYDVTTAPGWSVL